MFVSCLIPEWIWFDVIFPFFFREKMRHRSRSRDRDNRGRGQRGGVASIGLYDDDYRGSRKRNRDYRHWRKNVIPTTTMTSLFVVKDEEVIIKLLDDYNYNLQLIIYCTEKNVSQHKSSVSYWTIHCNLTLWKISRSLDVIVKRRFILFFSDDWYWDLISLKNLYWRYVVSLILIVL